jgi:DNA-binding response OmpR family regulator
MAKIMIVDDSRLARTYAAAILGRQGHEVVQVDPTSIFDVLRAAKEAVPDVLVMDFLMPNCPGASLARVCREVQELQAMRVLVLTAHRDDEVTGRLLDMGVDQVLHKPLEPQALADAVAAALAAATE